MTRVLVDGNGLCCVLWWANPANVPARFVKYLTGIQSDKCALAVAWDTPMETWRKSVLPDYKANRKPKPEALKAALEDCRSLPGFCHVQADGWEADDVIATLARKALEAGEVAVVVSRDKDMAQLVGPGCIWVSGIGPPMDAAAVQEKYGVPPERMRHLLSWLGDAADGLPGVAGYGAKRAAERALAGEIGNELTYELTKLATVPEGAMRWSHAAP
jgi:5'-3' exonuclease